MEVFWTSFFSITRFGSLIARSPGMRRALMGTLCLLVTGFSIGSAMHQFSQLRHVSKHFCAAAGTTTQKWMEKILLFDSVIAKLTKALRRYCTRAPHPSSRMPS